MTRLIGISTRTFLAHSTLVEIHFAWFFLMICSIYLCKLSFKSVSGFIFIISFSIGIFLNLSNTFCPTISFVSSFASLFQKNLIWNFRPFHHREHNFLAQIWIFHYFLKNSFNKSEGSNGKYKNGNVFSTFVGSAWDYFFCCVCFLPSKLLAHIRMTMFPLLFQALHGIGKGSIRFSSLTGFQKTLLSCYNSPQW